MRQRYRHPALNLLMFGRWDDALGWLHAQSTDVAPRYKLDDVLSSFGDRAAMPALIEGLVDDLYAAGHQAAGALALAWSMMLADPRNPASFRFLPQLQFEVDHAEVDEEDWDELRRRIRQWWCGAEGAWIGSDVSIFRLAAVEVEDEKIIRNLAEVDPVAWRPPDSGTTSTPASLFADLGLPHLVVMPKEKSTKLNNFHAAYKPLVDAALPLVIVARLAQIRHALHEEFPHATAAVDLLLRDLRDGKPFRLKPVCICGPAGAGKSRMVRRLVDLVDRTLWLYRFDCASSTDGHFAGTSKGWGNTEASVPMRAIAQSRIANPVVMLDEIDKAAASITNGQLSHSLLAFLERETAARYRDQSLDAEVDLSGVSFISTANDPTRISGPLRDRFRMIRVPAPTLKHLPALSRHVMRDLAIEDESRSHDAPLAKDELEVIARAWRRAGFSMRALQKIVGATLDARDGFAMRH